MNQRRKDDPQALERLAVALVDDLLSDSDDEISADILDAGSNIIQEADTMRGLIARAARQAGKARLQSAKTAVAAEKHSRATNRKHLNISEARQRLATILASNIGAGLSLAARKETGLSDRDVYNMLEDLEELGVLDETKMSDEGK